MPYSLNISPFVTKFFVSRYPFFTYISLFYTAYYSPRCCKTSHCVLCSYLPAIIWPDVIGFTHPGPSLSCRIFPSSPSTASLLHPPIPHSRPTQLSPVCSFACLLVVRVPQKCFFLRLVVSPGHSGVRMQATRAHLFCVHRVVSDGVCDWEVPVRVSVCLYKNL